MKKYYKFIFMALFGLFIFMPKDAHAMSIRIYDYDWNIVDECNNCTSLINNDWYPEDIYTIYFYYDNYQVVKNMEYEIENTFSLFVANPNLDLQMYAPVVWVNFVSQTYFSDYFAINRTESTSVPNLGTVYRHQIGSKGHFTSNTTITGTEFYENTVIYEFRYMQPLTFQGVRMDSYHLINLGDSTGDSINNATNNIINNNNQNTQNIINNNDKNTDRIVEGQKEINDYISSDEEPSADISALGDVQGLLPAGPVDSLLNIPFKFLSVIVSSLGDVCVPLSMNWVFNKTLTLPCFSDSFYNNVPDGLMIFINLIPSGFILITYFKHLYKKVNRAVSMETTADDEWGVL